MGLACAALGGFLTLLIGCLVPADVIDVQEYDVYGQKTALYYFNDKDEMVEISSTYTPIGDDKIDHAVVRIENYDFTYVPKGSKYYLVIPTKDMNK